jgi:ubiquinone/menaquinone biosynthesis C-methylase UbiE
LKCQTVPLKAIVELVNHLAETCAVLEEAGYDEAPVRAQVAALTRQFGDLALDVGTGACACMAVTLARQGISVMAVDGASSAVRMAQERATGKLAKRLKVRHADAARLPFPDGSYRAVVAFDALCHTADPVAVLAEMFRVCDDGGAVIITELNTAGREVTRHRDGGFEKKLPALLARHCSDCEQIEHRHHVTFVCEKER